MPYHLPACQWPHILWRQVSCPLYRQNCCGLEHNRGTRSGDPGAHNPSHYSTLATAKPASLASTHVRQIKGRTDARQALISRSYSRLEPPQHLLHHRTWSLLPVPGTSLWQQPQWGQEALPPNPGGLVPAPHICPDVFGATSPGLCMCAHVCTHAQTHPLQEHWSLLHRCPGDLVEICTTEHAGRVGQPRALIPGYFNTP